MTKFSATMSNGETVSRNSKTKVYTHAVETASSVARLREDAEGAIAYHRVALSDGERKGELIAKEEAKLAELEGHDDDELLEFGIARWSSSQSLALEDADSWAKCGFHAKVIKVS